MTSITPIPDDLGKQALQSEDARPVNTRAIEAVSPSRAIHTLGDSKEVQKNVHLQRRRQERRRGERRQHRSQVLFDTRSHRDRRQRQRRADSITKKPFRQGINVKV